MPTDLPILAPANYVTPAAIAFARADSTAIGVDDNHPLPTVTRPAAARSTPLAGSATGTVTAGPFRPDPGVPVQLRLWGGWSGTVQVRDSIDGGATKLPLTVAGLSWGGPYTGGPINEEAVCTPHVAGQLLYLEIVIATGTLNFWMGQ